MVMFKPDTFTLNDVLRCLDQANLKYRVGSKYVLTQCPMPDHQDKTPSAQIYKDDWFVNCHSGCGRFHITKAFPELRDSSRAGEGSRIHTSQRPRNTEAKEMSYKDVDLVGFWEKLPEIPTDHIFKGIPIDILHDLGWRYDPNGHRYFIPYFDRSRKFIPFAQWRNLGSGPRFNFWPEAKPIAYGLWNLDNSKIFVVEGTSDAAVLEYAAVPYIAMPSAASKAIMQSMSTFCQKAGLSVVYAGDNDSAGDGLLEALDKTGPYRLKQPPKKYKDWGDFLEADGIEAVQEYCFEELFGKKDLISNVEIAPHPELENIQKVFPGAEQLEIVGAEESSKEHTRAPID